MSGLLIKDKDVVVPGEVLAEGMDYLPGQGTYREGEKIHASRLGLSSVDGRAIKLIPMTGAYVPKANDTIIGRVKDVLLSGWIIAIEGSAYRALLSLKDATSEYIRRGADLRQYVDFNEYVICKILKATPQMMVDVTMRGPGLRKLSDGRIINVSTHKVPRIIGKKGSMVSMIKQATDCKIIVGQNGVIWISSQDAKMELLAIEAIKKIQEEAHISGLTDRIKIFLEEKTGKKIEITAPESSPELSEGEQ